MNYIWRTEFSNFYLPKWHKGIVFEGINYPTVEHFYVAMKSLDENVRLKVSNISKPGKAKIYGRRINLRPDWNEIKLKVMKYGLMIKFNDSYLMNLLNETNSWEIVEFNYWHDNYWGKCICNRCINKVKLNNLGVLLMDLRGVK